MGCVFCVYVCVCMCVCEREREGGREGGREREHTHVSVLNISNRPAAILRDIALY